MERVAAKLPNARLVRIKPEHPEVPSELGGVRQRLLVERQKRWQDTRGEPVIRQEAS